FGTVTAHRWPVSFELRAFVMVGLCGGFTTFSAFSLQTLELARFGRWLEASGNVLLSVVLCLVAVWVGHALADLLSGPGPRSGAEQLLREGGHDLARESSAATGMSLW